MEREAETQEKGNFKSCAAAAACDPCISCLSWFFTSLYGHSDKGGYRDERAASLFPEVRAARVRVQAGTLVEGRLGQGAGRRACEHRRGAQIREEAERGKPAEV